MLLSGLDTGIIPIRLRSGRHNYEGLSVLDAGIVIDVSEMKQVEIDYNYHTVTVQDWFT